MRRIIPAVGFLAAWVLPCAAHATPLTIDFTATIGTSNNIDTGDVFGEGYGANLTGQEIDGSITIDPSPFVQACSSIDPCWGDFGAGALTVSFTLNGITATVTSSGTLGFLGDRSGGSVSITDSTHGNSFEIAAASPDGMVEETVGAAFGNSTLFDAYGGGDPNTAIGSLDAIGQGNGLVWGGITYLSPVEHLDATIDSIDAIQVATVTTSDNDIPEPSGNGLLGLAVAALWRARRRWNR